MEEGIFFSTDLQQFLQTYGDITEPKKFDIQKALEKADSQVSSLNRLDTSFSSFTNLHVNSDIANKRKSQISEGLYQKVSGFSTTLTSLPSVSRVFDSLIDEDIERDNLSRQISVKKPVKPRDLALSAIKEAKTITKLSAVGGSIEDECFSARTDPGLYHKSSLFSDGPNQSTLSTRIGSSARLRSQNTIDKSLNEYKKDDSEDENSDAEDIEGFLMIKPFRKESANIEVNSAPQNKPCCISFDEDIFTQDMVDYANLLKSNSFSSYIKDLISHVYSNGNKNAAFYAKRRKNEALFSVSLKDNARNSLERLLLDVSLKLKEESVSFKQKFKSVIFFFEAKMLKAIRTSDASVKFEEKEFQKLSEQVNLLLSEKCLIESRSALKRLANFLEHILDKFASPIKVQETSDDSDVSVTLEYVTLPRLLEKVITQNEFTFFYRDILIHTYDLYITPINLLLYLIFRYFTPKPLNMSKSEQKAFQTTEVTKTKYSILSLLTFWLEDRSSDFIRTPSLLTILSAFLEKVQILERNSDVTHALQALWSLHQKVTQKLIRREEKENPSLVFNMDNSVNSGYCASALTKTFHSTRRAYKQSRKTMDGGEKPLAFLSFSKTQEEPAQCNYTFEELLLESNENIARQLTLLDWKQFSDIEISELLNKRWTKKDKKECPHYWTHVSHFNAFSSWIQYVLVSQESFRRRMDIAEKFLQIALVCVKEYKNYCSSNCIFSALFTLSNFGVISIEKNLNLKADFEELKKIFAPSCGSYIKLYNEIFKEMPPPAIPNLNVFLKIFLKLQDGVKFWVTMPESQVKFLKFQPLSQIYDYYKEMKKFQKADYNHIQKTPELYGFLKSGFEDMVPFDLNNSEEVMKKINEMTRSLKKNQSKLFRFFGVKMKG